MPQFSDQHAYLNHVMERTGWSQTELAARAGLDPSTLSRFLSASRKGHSLRVTTIRKIEAISGLAFASGAPEELGEDIVDGFGEPEAVPLIVPSESPIAKIVAVLNAGKNNIDPWTMRSRALEGAGYRPGDILLVSLNATPVAGDVVCAQIYDWTKGKAETVFRLFQPPYLVAATSDPDLMRPHVVDDGRVVLKGVVMNSIRNRGSS